MKSLENKSSSMKYRGNSNSVTRHRGMGVDRKMGAARLLLLRAAVPFQALLIRLRFIAAESEGFQRGVIVLLFSFQSVALKNKCSAYS